MTAPLRQQPLVAAGIIFGLLVVAANFVSKWKLFIVLPLILGTIVSHYTSAALNSFLLRQQNLAVKCGESNFLVMTRLECRTVTLSLFWRWLLGKLLGSEAGHLHVRFTGVRLVVELKTTSQNEDMAAFRHIVISETLASLKTLAQRHAIVFSFCKPVAYLMQFVDVGVDDIKIDISESTSDTVVASFVIPGIKVLSEFYEGNNMRITLALRPKLLSSNGYQEAAETVNSCAAFHITGIDCHMVDDMKLIFSMPLESAETHVAFMPSNVVVACQRLKVNLTATQTDVGTISVLSDWLRTCDLSIELPDFQLANFTYFPQVECKFSRIDVIVTSLSSSGNRHVTLSLEKPCIAVSSISDLQFSTSNLNLCGCFQAERQVQELIAVEAMRLNVALRFAETSDGAVEHVTLRCRADTFDINLPLEAAAIPDILAEIWRQSILRLLPAVSWDNQYMIPLSAELGILKAQISAAAVHDVQSEGITREVLLKIKICEANFISRTSGIGLNIGDLTEEYSGRITTAVLEQEVLSKCSTCIRICGADIRAAREERELRESVIGPPVIQIDMLHGTWNPLLMRSFGALVGNIMAELKGPLDDANGGSVAPEANHTVVLKRAFQPLTDDLIRQMLSLDEKALPFLSENSCAVVQITHVIVDFPFRLWRTADETLQETLTGGESERIAQGESAGNQTTAVWDCLSVEVNGLTLVVRKSIDMASLLPPSILLHLRDIEIFSTGLNEWSHIPTTRPGFNDDTSSVPAFVDSTGQRIDSDQCPTRDTDRMKRTLRRFFSVDAFAMESFCDKVIELFIARVHGRWSQAVQLRLLKAVRDVTFSVWDMLLTARSLRNASVPDLIVSYPLNDMDAFQRWMGAFKAGLLGSGGNKLHRMYALDIHIESSFRGSSDDLVELDIEKLYGIDLPELWDVCGISFTIEGHPTAIVDRMSIRHTLDNRQDMVLGAALQEVYARAFSCGHSNMSNLGIVSGVEGYSVSIQNAKVLVGTKFDIADAVSDQLLQVRALVNALLRLPGSWIPDSPMFRRLFKSSTTYEKILFGQKIGSTSMPHLWLRAEGVSMGLADDPLESWLELTYPIWLEDLQFRALREEQLRRKIEAVRKTNSRHRAMEIIERLEHDFIERNATVYMNRVAPQLSNIRAKKSEKLKIELERCEAHLQSIPLALALQTGKEMVRLLDNCPPPDDALYDLFSMTEFQLQATNPCVSVRRFARPIFEASAVRLEGSILATQAKLAPEFHTISIVKIDDAVPPEPIELSYEMPRVYLTTKGHVHRPLAAFSPSYEFSLEEIAAGCGALFPSSMTSDLKWWDTARRLVTISMDITASELKLSLLPSLKTFAGEAALSTAAKAILHSKSQGVVAPTIELDEELSISVDRLQLLCDGVKVTLNAEEMAVEQVPAPDEIFPLACLPALRLDMRYTWNCRGAYENRNFYPIACAEGRIANLRECHSSLTSTKEEILQSKVKDIFWGFRSHGLSLEVSACIMALRRGTAMPMHFDGSCNIQDKNGHLIQSQMRRSAATISTIRVCLYGSSVPWLANFASAFKRIPPVPYPPKCRPDLDSGLWGLKSHIRSLRFDSISIEDTCEFIIYDEPTRLREDGIQRSQGLRILLHEGGSASLSMTQDTSHPNPFLTGHLVADPDDPLRLWILHDISAEIGLTEGRICTQDSDSRGEFLFSLKSFSFKQAHRSNDGTSLLYALELNNRTTKNAKISTASASSISVAEEKGEQSFVDNESDKRSNLFGEPNAYLNAAKLDTLKVVITLSTRNTLMELTEFFHQTILDADSGKTRPPKFLILGKLSTPDYTSSHASKEQTSLAAFMAVNDRTILPQRSSHIDSTLRQLPDVSRNMPRYDGEASDRCNDNSGDRNDISTVTNMGGLFIVQVTNVQAQLLEEKSGGCVIFAIGDGTVQGWIGISPPDNLKDNSRLCETLQRLIRRDLSTFVEAINVQVRAASIYAAPSDLSSGQCQWIPFSQGESYMRSLGIFRCLLTPVPLIEGNLVVKHGAIPEHSIRVEVPEVHVSSDAEHFKIVQDVATVLTAPPIPSLRRKELERLNRRLQDAILVNDDSANSMTTVAQGWARKQEAQWELNALQSLLWSLQLYRDSSISEAEMMNTTNEAKSFESFPSEDGLGLLIRSRRSVSVVARVAADEQILDEDVLVRWISTTEDKVKYAAAENTLAALALERLVRESKQTLQVQPHINCTWNVGMVEIQLLTVERPLATLLLSKISGILTVFGADDGSGHIEVDLYQLSATHGASDTSAARTNSDNKTGGTGAATLLSEQADKSGATLIAALNDFESKRISGTMRKAGIGKSIRCWNEIEPMLRLQTTIGSPVGGITLVRHLEFNICPIVLNLTRSTIAGLHEFFSLRDESAERARENVTRHSFLPNTGTQINKSSLKTRLFSGAIVSGTDMERARATSLASDEGEDMISRESMKSTASSNSLNDLETMHTRAKSNISFQYLRLGQLTAFVSYQGKNWRMLEDFDSLLIKLHPFIFRNKTCTTEELLLSVRNHAVIDIMSQVNRNFVNIGAFLASKFSGTGAGCCDSSGQVRHLVSEHESDEEPSDTEGESAGGKEDGKNNSGETFKSAVEDANLLEGSGGRELLFGRTPNVQNTSRLSKIKSKATKMFSSPLGKAFPSSDS